MKRTQKNFGGKIWGYFKFVALFLFKKNLKGLRVCTPSAQDVNLKKLPY